MTSTESEIPAAASTNADSSNNTDHGPDVYAQPDLQLSRQLCLLRCDPELVPDRESISASVLASIQENDMLPLYEALAPEFGWKLSEDVLAQMKSNNEKRLAELDNTVKDAEENLGESEIREGLLVKALYLTQIGDKNACVQALDVALDKAVGQGEKLDVLFTKIRVGFFWEDAEMIESQIERAQGLVEKGGDWDRKNRLKTYEGLQAMRIRDFSKAAQLFFDTLATFTSYELFKYNDFVRYCVLMATLTLERPALKARVIDSPEILSVILDIPHLSQFLNSFYDCDYKLFFVSLGEIVEELKTDVHMAKHQAYFCREMRIKAYSQMLESYRSVQLTSMADAFGVTPAFMDKELARFVASGRLSCKIDKVNDVIQTTRAESKSAQYQTVVQQGDLLLNRIHKLSRYLQ